MLSRAKEHLKHFLMLTRVSKSKGLGKDMLDCFINIYEHTELVDWLYRVNFAAVCKCIAM